jgi:hypothetical protein
VAREKGIEALLRGALRELYLDEVYVEHHLLDLAIEISRSRNSGGVAARIRRGIAFVGGTPASRAASLSAAL